MDDPNKSSSLLSLPPGCRFYPSEEEIFQYYLRLKNNPSGFEESNACGVIKEINLCNFNPFDLPDAACFSFGCRGRKKHWYCYRERINGGEGRARLTGFGYWKRIGKVRDVMGETGGRKVVLGKRTCFVFYSRNADPNSDNQSKRVVRTDWFMYEYELIDNLKATFVLCRIFLKSRNQNYVLEHALSCCAEDSGATIRHIGIQVPSDMQLNNQVISSELAGDTAVTEDSLDAQHSIFIQEGDFIELDDLV